MSGFQAYDPSRFHPLLVENSVFHGKQESLTHPKSVHSRWGRIEQVKEELTAQDQAGTAHSLQS